MIYGNNVGGLAPITNELRNPSELLEMYILDEVSKLSDEKIQEFCKAGGEGDALVEAAVMRKKTLVRLSKLDDQQRRTTMASFHMAKEAKDPLWDQLVKNRIKEKKLISQIKKKYGTKAKRVAKIGQKKYLKTKMPLSFMRAGGADRL